MINNFNSKHNKQHITKYFILFLFVFLLPIECAEIKCPQNCQQCFITSSNSNPTIFSCLSCKNQTSSSQQITPYIWSCQTQNLNNAFKPIFIIFCIVIVCLDLFMLSMGFGVYQIIYEQIQLVGIMAWVNFAGGSVMILQGTGFGVERGNSFFKSYGVQFIIFLFTICVFMFSVVASLRIPHNPTAILIRRKRVIFPTRIGFLCFCMLLFASIVSLNSMQQLSKIDILQLFLSVIGLITSVALYLGAFYLCNFKKFKLDDTNYYVITQNMVSTRWWVKNKLFIQATNHVCIIMAFVLGFSRPNVAIIPMFVSHILFTLYILLFIKYTKLRYKIFIVISCLLFLSILIFLYIITSSILISNSFSSSLQAIYIFLTIALCCLFILAVLVEMIAQKHKIARQLRSFKNRFILCDKLEKEISTNKYDTNGGHRKRVNEWEDNVVYGWDLSGVRQKFGVTHQLTS